MVSTGERSEEILTLGAAARLLGISPSYLRKLTNAGSITAQHTPGGHRRYRAETLLLEWERFRSTPATVRPPDWAHAYALPTTTEDRVWAELRSALESRSGELRPLARRILGYAVTEMVNNAIDHSGGSSVEVSVTVADGRVVIAIHDDGVGAFRRMADELGYPDPAAAIVDITKGKRTTAPDRHSGEGIFFTSKAVDVFALEANGYRVVFDNLIHDVGLGTGSSVGTTVTLQLALNTSRQLVDVFAAHTNSEGEFDRTTPRIELIQFGGEFVSRSEAKRFAEGLEKFRRVVLDFAGVEMLGQGFADELFRVWQVQHPEVQLSVVGANPAVALMINRVGR